MASADPFGPAIAYLVLAGAAAARKAASGTRGIACTGQSPAHQPSFGVASSMMLPHNLFCTDTDACKLDCILSEAIATCRCEQVPQLPDRQPTAELAARVASLAQAERATAFARCEAQAKASLHAKVPPLPERRATIASEAERLCDMRFAVCHALSAGFSMAREGTCAVYFVQLTHVIWICALPRTCWNFCSSAHYLIWFILNVFKPHST